MRGKCRRCGKKVPSTHGYCIECALYEDGFRTGHDYVDDFEGTTDEEAEDAAVQVVEETWDEVSEGVEDLPRDAKGRYANGVVEGLKRQAKVNAKRLRELEEEMMEPGPSERADEEARRYLRRRDPRVS